MKIIILSKTPYKEKDLIFNAISEDKFFSFRGRGVLDNKSPHVWLNNDLTIADIEVGEDKRSKYLTLKEAKPILSPMFAVGDLYKMYAIGAIAQVVNKTLEDNEKSRAFSTIESAINALKEGRDFQMVVLIFLARMLALCGSAFNVDSCVGCGSTKDVVAFSFVEGGFICRNCLSPDDNYPKLNNNQLKLIRYIFKAPDFKCVGADMFNKEDKNVLLEHLRLYFFDNIGVSVDSISKLIY